MTENHHEHDHGQDHDHVLPNHKHEMLSISGKKIFWVTVLNATITIAEIAGGLLSGSLALLSDALHNLSDTIAIALSYFANRIAQKPKDAKRTYGYKRAEILSAFVNASVLLALSFILIIEAIKRLNAPKEINGTLMIIVASIGLVANLLSVFLLEKDSHANLNIKSSYLHLLSDTVSSVGVLIGGLAIQFWDIVWIDPVVTILISLFILRETWHIIKTTIDILMQSAPSLDYDSIKRDVENVEHVQNIHHVHAWMINERTLYFEAHLDFEDMMLSDIEKICEHVEHLLQERYGVSHVTLQAEVNKCCGKNFFTA